MSKLLIVIALLTLIGCDKKSEKPSDIEPMPENKVAVSKDESAVEVIALHHGSLLLKWNDVVIAVDPVSKALDAHDGNEPKADLILVTHIHGDHLDPKAIAMLRKEGAPVVAPQSVIDKAGAELPNPSPMANGDSKSFLPAKINVEAVEMYNLKRKREDNGEFFHPKGVGNGYVITLGTERIYISGDTECTPEMKLLKDIDVAFVCMNLPYTMTPEEAAECLAEFKPKTLYPYHYRDQDPAKLKTLLKDAPIEIKLLDWYPSAESTK